MYRLKELPDSWRLLPVNWESLFPPFHVISRTVLDSKQPNKRLTISMFITVVAPTDAPYWVLGTDYTSYAVVWSCNSYGIVNSQVEIISRHMLLLYKIERLRHFVFVINNRLRIFSLVSEVPTHQPLTQLWRSSVQTTSAKLHSASQINPIVKKYLFLPLYYIIYI